MKTDDELLPTPSWRVVSEGNSSAGECDHDDDVDEEEDMSDERFAALYSEVAGTCARIRSIEERMRRQQQQQQQSDEETPLKRARKHNATAAATSDEKLTPHSVLRCKEDEEEEPIS